MREIIFALFASLSTPAAAKTYPFDHAKGQNRIINFWAVWCEACLVELKEFNTELKNLPATIVLINLDSDPEKGRKWLAEHFQLSHVFVEDPKFKIAEHFSLEAFPLTFLCRQRVPM